MPYLRLVSIIIGIIINNYIFQETGNRCDLTSPVGLLIPNGGIAPVRINFGDSLIPVSSVAVKVEQFSFVFVATRDWILGVRAAWLSQLVCK